MELKTQVEEATIFLDGLVAEYQEKEQQYLDSLPKEVRVKAGKPIKEITSLDKFMANGHKYVINTSLTVARFEQFEKVQTLVTYGLTLRQLFDNMQKQYEYMNAGKIADASVLTYNMMNGVKNGLEERTNDVLILCSLFISREDEDLSTYDERIAERNIADWRKEGISMDSFFTLSFSLVNGFTPILQEVSLNISERLKA